MAAPETEFGELFDTAFGLGVSNVAFPEANPHGTSHDLLAGAASYVAGRLVVRLDFDEGSAGRAISLTRKCSTDPGDEGEGVPAMSILRPHDGSPLRYGHTEREDSGAGLAAGIVRGRLAGREDLASLRASPHLPVTSRQLTCST